MFDIYAKTFTIATRGDLRPQPPAAARPHRDRLVARLAFARPFRRVTKG